MVVLQAAIRGSGPAGECLRLGLEGSVAMLVSLDTFTELRDVLNRPAIRSKFRVLTPSVIDSLLQNYFLACRLVDPVPPLVTLERDRKDEPYLNLAIAGRATHLITRDHDLLDINLPTSAAHERVRVAAPSLRVVDPADWLRDVRAAGLIGPGR